MHPSLETKARCPDPAPVHLVLRRRGASLVEVVSQRDVYFDAVHGRLKLRTSGPADGSGGSSSVLIAYDRPSRSGPRLSRFWVVPVDDDEACREGLAAVLGVRTEVRKRREVWRVGSTTVHLDQVAGLGGFLEMETSTEAGPEPAATEHQDLSAALGIRAEDTIAGSYSDLLLSAPPPAPSATET